MCEDIELEHYYINNQGGEKDLYNIDINVSVSNQDNLLQENTNSMISIKDDKEKKNKFVVNKVAKEKENVKTMKYKIPFLKEFNIKFTKRENIDKKLLRKFRKFLKDKIRKGTINLESFDLNEPQKEFWYNFASENLMPPMVYSDSVENVEFKSFNTNYMVWLLSHKASVELYNYYLEEKMADVINTFTSKYNIKKSDELCQLNTYIKHFAYIFYSVKDHNEESNNVAKEEEENKTIMSITKTEEITYEPLKIVSVNNTPIFINVAQNGNNNASKGKQCDDIFSANKYGESNFKNGDNEYERMFNNSFDYDKDYIFHEE